MRIPSRSEPAMCATLHRFICRGAGVFGACDSMLPTLRCVRHNFLEEEGPRPPVAFSA